MISNTNPELVDEIKEVFALFDANGNGRLPCDKLGDCLRALGHTPSSSQVQDLIQSHDSSNNGYIDINTLLEILSSSQDQFNTICSKDIILKGFKALDKDGLGIISTNELKHLLMNVGEKLTEKEVDELLNQVPKTKDGCIKYEGNMI